MIRSLSQYFRFRFYDLNKILISCILRYNSPNYCLLDTIREIYSLVAGDSILHIQPIIEAFILLDEVKRLPEERERYESTYKALEYLLTKYYSVEEPRNDDDELWIYLGQGKDVSNLELVSQFAGTPGAHAMKLLGL